MRCRGHDEELLVLGVRGSVEAPVLAQHVVACHDEQERDAELRSGGSAVGISKQARTKAFRYIGRLVDA